MADDANDRWRVLFDEARRENGLGNRERAEELVSLAIDEANNLPRDSESFTSAQGSFALWRYCQDRFAEAEILFRQYMDGETRLGVGARELANMTMFLAEFQQKQGKLPVAKATIEMAINTYPPECLPELSQAYADLASLGTALGEWGAAAEATKKSDELRKAWDDMVAARKSSKSQSQESEA